MPALIAVLGVLYLVCFVFLWLRIEVLRMSNAEQINAAVDQLTKASSEIVSKIADLEAAVAAGEDLSGPLAALSEVAQSLDDIVLDAPAEG